jgi:tripartite ATP-independent transporter DctP family solute receptor
MEHKRMTWLCLVLAMMVMLPSANIIATPQQEPVEEVVLKVGHIFTATHVAHRSLEAMAEYVDKETNGGLKLEIFPGGQLGKGAKLSENVMLGAVDMATAGPGLLSRIEPAFAIWGAEFMFTGEEALFKVIKSSVGQEIYERLRNNHGIRVVGTGYLGARHLTTSKVPVRTPADLEGLKIRIPNIPYRREAFIAMGAAPTPMAFQELYLALQQGVVDGQENPLQQITSMKFQEVQKYLTLTAHAQNPEMLIINDEKYASLPESYQEVLLEGGEVYGDTCRRLFKEEDAKLLEQVKNAGVQIIEPDLAAFREAVKDVPKKFEDEWGAGLYERVKEAQR